MKTYYLHNFATGQRMAKTQRTTPKVKGFTVVRSERILPERNAAGERLFYDANNRPYYARVNKDGFHYQP